MPISPRTTNDFATGILNLATSVQKLPRKFELSL